MSSRSAPRPRRRKSPYVNRARRSGSKALVRFDESNSETSLSSNSEHSISSGRSEDDSGSNTDTDVDNTLDSTDTYVPKNNAARKSEPQKAEKRSRSGDKRGKKIVRKSPRTKKKKYPEPESILREVPLKPPNTEFASNDKTKSSSLYQKRSGQKVEFSPENVVCTFGTRQYLSHFKKKLAKAKETFDTSAPFPPGSKGQGQPSKSILKK